MQKLTFVIHFTPLSPIAYSHSEAVQASFPIAWKIAQAKTFHTAGESLIKPAAVEIAKIMCGNVVAC